MDDRTFLTGLAFIALSIESAKDQMSADMQNLTRTMMRESSRPRAEKANQSFFTSPDIVADRIVRSLMIADTIIDGLNTPEEELYE